MSQRIIVVGGLSAGPSAAAKARRENENVEIILFEKSENISYATCGIPYALSGVIPSRDKLLIVEADLLRTRFNIDVRLQEEVLEIFPSKKEVKTSEGVYAYDKLIFATGARPVIPPINNINIATNWSTCRSLGDFDKIMKEGLLDSVSKIAVLGSGLIGVEVAENIRKLGKEVVIIEGVNQILPMWQPKFSFFAQRELEEHGVNIYRKTFVNEFVLEGNRAKQLLTSSGELIDVDFVIVSTGIKPNTELLVDKGATALENGALKVNKSMETSLKDIYAAGDNVSIINRQTNKHDYMPLGTHSNKGGRVAGANAVGSQEEFKGANKTAIIKVFDYTLARTGLNGKDLQELGWEYKTNLIIAGATPGYFPDQKDMIIEIFFDLDNYKIFGAEIFGEIGVDKRIDVLSTAIYANLKITDLPHLDLAYAPPFSPAKDPVVVNGLVTSNNVNKTYDEISVEELKTKLDNNEDIQILDVRAESEILTTGTIHPKAITIDVNSLRDNLHLLDKDKEIIVNCAKGMRGYLAVRILNHNNFKSVKNLSGGFKVWQMIKNQVVDKV